MLQQTVTEGCQIPPWSRQSSLQGPFLFSRWSVTLDLLTSCKRISQVTGVTGDVSGGDLMSLYPPEFLRGLVMLNLSSHVSQGGSKVSGPLGHDWLSLAVTSPPPMGPGAPRCSSILSKAPAARTEAGLERTTVMSWPLLIQFEFERGKQDNHFGEGGLAKNWATKDKVWNFKI